MNRRFTFAVILLTAAVGKAAAQDVKLYPNNLIISPQAVEALKKKTDSAEKVWRTQKPGEYWSYWQAEGAYFSDFTSQDADTVFAQYLSALQRGVSESNFRAMYQKGPEWEGRNEVFLIQDSSLYNRIVQEGRSLPEKVELVGKNRLWSEIMTLDSGDLLLNYEKRARQEGFNSFKALYLHGAFVQKKLPERYARLVDYARHIMPENSALFLTSNVGVMSLSDSSRVPINFFGEEWYRLSDTFHAVSNFFRLLGDEFVSPDSQAIVALFHNNRRYKQLLSIAADTLIRNNRSNEALEKFALKYLSIQTAIDLMRRRLPSRPNCTESNDHLHALAILQLAAENGNWEVYMRAQGFLLQYGILFNTALQEMSTVAEWENSGIRVDELVLGLALDLPKKQSIEELYPLAYAASKSRYQRNFQKQAILMLKDTELDLHNRMRVLELCLQYISTSGEFEMKKLIYKDSKKWPVLMQERLKRSEEGEN